jgi:hypothetical protein
MMQIIICWMPGEKPFFSGMRRLLPRAKRARYRLFPRDVAMPSLVCAVGPQAQMDNRSGFPAEAKARKA